jgi:hypothetical protein
MTAHWRPAADRLVGQLQSVFGNRLRSVVAYGPQVEAHEPGVGPLTCMGLVTAITAEDLAACAKLSAAWQRERIATPLLLPEEEFRRSLDAFPLEYGEMWRAHELLVGANPFDGISIDPADLRRACETQIKSHLVHLRQGFIETGGTPRAVTELVSASAPAFGALLRNIARLCGPDGNGASAAHDRAAATRDGARLAQVPDAIVTDILSLERPSAVTTTDGAKLFPEYLAAVEQLARFIDTWGA